MDSIEEERFRLIFRSAHADHASCRADEWLHAACVDRSGAPAERPLVWSRRNGPWRRVPLLWVGAAPGNAGGLGAGDMGAHATRIPFGGDIAGGNLDVLLSSIGLNRNHTFIVASLNQLPAKGGGEPTATEIAAPVGDLPDSIGLLRDTILATGPELIVALGNVALRAMAASLTRPDDGAVGARRTIAPARMPTKTRLDAAGFVRGRPTPWPADSLPLSAGFIAEWQRAWGAAPRFQVLPLLHPSGQNMSPFARTETQFHQRMLQTRDSLVAAVREVLGTEAPHARPAIPADGIYALPEWRERIAERHGRFDELWRERGV